MDLLSCRTLRASPLSSCPLVLTLLLGGATLAQEGPRAASTPGSPAPLPDLEGSWTVSRDDPGSPGARVRLGSRRTRGQEDGYAVTLRVSGAERSGRGRFEGALLRIQVEVPATAVPTTGLIEVLSDSRRDRTPVETTRRARATYELRRGARTERFRLTGGDPGFPGSFERPRELDVVCPAEWEASQEVLWATPSRTNSFGEVGIYAEAVAGTRGVRHRIFTTSDADALYVAQFLGARLGEAAWERRSDEVELGERVPLDTIWMRDYGPLTCRRLRGRDKVVGDSRYFPGRENDDALPVAYARARGWEHRPVPLQFEGGNFISDGAGRVFMTRIVAERNGGQEAAEDALALLGARQVEWFEPLPEHDGTGHIDMFAKLTGPSSAVVGDDAPGALNDAHLDRAAAQLTGLGFQVSRLRMGRNPRLGKVAAQLQTYSNSLFVGRVALVPQYGGPRDGVDSDPETVTRDLAALQVYRQSGYTPVPVDARAVIPGNGAVHCISMQVPR